MAKHYKIFTAIIIAIIFIDCNQQKTDDAQSNTSKQDTIKYKPPMVIPVNKDSLPTFTPGENGVPLPKVVKAGKPEVHHIANLPIIPGVSYFPQTLEERATGKKPIMTKKPKKVMLDTSTLKILTQGKDGLELPKVYIIEKPNSPNLINNSYTIQHGDTIYQPITKTYPTPKSKPALAPRYKDNATKNIQYLGPNEGLTSVIWSIIEDIRGNIWFATFEGAICYDGSSFTKFTIKEGLKSNWVMSIFEDKSGKLWFIHSDTGLGVSCYNGKSFTHYTTEQGLISNYINSMHEDVDGSIWFCTKEGLTCYHGNSFTNYNTKQGLCDNNVNTVFKDKNGKLWVATWKGLSSFNGKSFTNFTSENGYNWANSILEDSDGKLWFAGGRGAGLSCFDGKSFTHYTKEQGLSSNNIKRNALLEDSKGNIWIGTNNGLNCYNGNSFTYIKTEQGLTHNFVTSILEDKSGNIWIATRSGGANCYSPESFTHFTTEQGLKHNTVWSTLEEDNGDLWFGTWGGGVSYYNGESFANNGTKQGLTHNDVRSIIRDKRGNVWFGTSNGLTCYDGESFIQYTTEQGLCNNFIVHLFEDKKGNIWIGTWGGGMSCWDGKSFTNFNTIKEIGTERVRPLYEDKEGNLWIGSWGGGVSCYDGKKFTNYTTEQGLSSNLVYSIIEDEDGNLLIGTEDGGVSCFNGESFTNYTTEEGLCSNFVLSMLKDKKGDLWIGTYNGLSYLKPGNYFTKGGNKDEIEASYNFSKLDGLKGSIIHQNSTYLDSKNRMWCGTNNALTMLDLNKFELPESKPTIQLNTIEIQENFVDYRLLEEAVLSNDSTGFVDNLHKEYKQEIIFIGVADFYNYPLNLELPYHLNHLIFHFSAIDWAAPHKLQYQYQLEGFDKQYSQLTAENKADYRNIPYGKYVFKVKAIGAAKKWSETFEYSFVIHPPWWHTWWARTLYVIAGLLLIWAIIRWRTAKLLQRQKKLEHTVKVRTLEISEKNEELTNQKEELFQQNEEIASQRDQLDIQHTAITDSIVYAKRIQKAVLPPEVYVDEILPENFILFKPKDVVSGDFYWIRQINNYVVIVAADCTGHGVPGAIMSMLGVSFLNEIVRKREITKANQILNELRIEVKRSLRQSGKNVETRDGMDVALCVIETKTNKMQFSGAYNPLYLFRNGEFIEVKADRMPIGIYLKEKNSFTNHEIDLQPNDVFYIFSDGFSDQIGGPENKKYLTKNFRQLLFDIHEEPMDVQKEKLEKTITKWQANNSQTDDILVMGVRV